MDCYFGVAETADSRTESSIASSPVELLQVDVDFPMKELKARFMDQNLEKPLTHEHHRPTSPCHIARPR